MNKDKYKISRLSIFLLALLLLVIAGLQILNPFENKYYNKEWEKVLWENERKIENEVSDYFSTMQIEIINVLDEIKTAVTSNNTTKKQSFLLSFINKYSYKNYDISIYKKNKIFAWTDNNNVNSNRLKLENYEFNEIHFRHTDLFTNLCVIDTVQHYQIMISKPVEKYYILENEYSHPLSLSQSLGNKYNTLFKIKYYPEAKLNSNKIQHSFEISNNFNNKIGLITFNKLNIETEIDIQKSSIKSIKGIVWIIFVVVAGFTFRKYFFCIKNNGIKYIILFIYIFILRYLLYYFAIPGYYVSGWLTDTNFFSSLFAFGIVSSPLELLITITCLLFLSYRGFKYSLEFYNTNNKEVKPVYVLISGLILFVYMASLRGLGATLKSVIFDSTLLYFDSTALLPDFPAAIMHLNVLIFGFCSIMFSITLFVLILALYKKKITFGTLTLSFFIIQVIGIIYDVSQNEPQGTPFLRIIYILLTFILAVILLDKKKIRKTYYVIFLFSASFITINFLNFYNNELEKYTLKNAAREFTAPDKLMVKKLITQVFEKAKEELIDENLYINEKINFDAYSFIVWSNSVLHKKSMSSTVGFYNKNKELMGDFQYKYEFPSRDTLCLKNYSFKNGEIKFDEPTIGNRKIIRGVMPIYHKNEVEGYLVIKVNFGLAKTIFKRAPRFLSDLKSAYKSPVNLRELKIFSFTDKKLKNVFGDIYPGLTVQKEILSLDFSKEKSLWKKLEFGENSYNTYILKYGQKNENKILVLALLKKDITRNIFDFFKIFFVHTFFILVIVSLMLLVNFRQGRSFKYSFKTQLLISFLVISIMPLIFLAAYFRDLQEEKNTSAIFYKLKKRAVSVENFINSKLITSNKSLKKISDLATTDLGIEFNVYDEDNLVYTSYPEYFQIGLFTNRLNPVAYRKLVLEGYNEFVNVEKVDNMEYSSFYYYGNIGDSYYILKVNDILNAYLLPMSGTEIDIFLFGSYSFVAILIVIFSTIIANQISQPIRKLTEATRSVAAGELELELYQQARGEVKELVEGFNTMLKDLQQSRNELAEIERETAWKEMARQVAHEIKNPLTPMKLAVQQLVIARKDKSPRFEDIFTKVTKTFDQQIDTLRNIADEFSNFARMPEPNRKKIDIVKVVNDAANLYVDKRAKVKIVTKLEKCFITGDEDQLKRTIINMVRNSIQASSTKITIEILHTDYSIVKITDNGKGIPDRIKNKIFDANFTTKVEGMGLGLNMAKRFINKIGGEISIAKSDKTGTVFLIKFPKG